MAKTIFSKEPQAFIQALASALKKVPEFQVPEWAFYVKSGTSRQRPPANDEFWYTRAASILRQLYIQGVVGVGRLRSKYGSRKDRGGMPAEFRKAGGKIIRVILQQAEAAGLVEKVSRLQFGRRLTQKGKDFLDSLDVPEVPGLDLSNVTLSSQPVAQEGDDEELLEDDEEDDE